MTYTTTEIQNRAHRLVDAEVNVCLSSLVSTLAVGYGTSDSARDLGALIEQAFDLASPVPDYESAATDAKWTGPHTDEFGAPYFLDTSDNQTWACADWQSLCAAFDIEPYESEVFEHWSVSSWLADKLIAHGEKVDKDFAGMCVWARTTTGQAIASDYVIEQIARECLDVMAALTTV